MIILPILVLLIVASTVLGFTVGRYYERVEWNRLIEEGKIPAPRSTK